MRKVVMLSLIGTFCLSIGMNAYLLWPSRAISEQAPKPKEKKAQEKPEAKPDPLMHFVPDGWSISSSKVQRLDRIYLPFLHRKFVGEKVRIAHIEGPGAKKRGRESL